MTSKRTTERLVWDLPLRIFHWLFAASVMLSWITAEIGSDVRQFHMWLGFWMIGLLAFRLAWGLVGTRHARFASFIPGPRAVIAHVRELKSGGPAASPGHNPVGSLMILAMLILVALQAISGLFMDDDVMFAGPYASVAGEAVRETMKAIHFNLIYFVLALAALHVVANVYLSVFRKQRLIHAMWTGKKPADQVAEHEAISSSRVWLAAAVAATIAIVMANLSWF